MTAEKQIKILQFLYQKIIKLKFDLCIWIQQEKCIEMKQVQIGLVLVQ